MVTKTKHRKEFRDKADTFIRSVIRHRRMLITEGKSSVNEMKALRIMEEITNSLPYTNFTNKGMAKFFLSHADDIRYLIKADDVNKSVRYNQLKMLSKSHQYLQS